MGHNCLCEAAVSAGNKETVTGKACRHVQSYLISFTTLLSLRLYVCRFMSTLCVCMSVGLLQTYLRLAYVAVYAILQ